eukprot:scaffold118421_cov34-Prasinocladus_malaysianus.AAC.1
MLLPARAHSLWRRWQRRRGPAGWAAGAGRRRGRSRCPRRPAGQSPKPSGVVQGPARRGGGNRRHRIYD